MLCVHVSIVQAYVAVDQGDTLDAEVVEQFLSDPVHDALAVCAELRPSVDIAVSSSGAENAGSIRPELR